MKLNRNVSDTILVLQTTDRCLIVVTMTKRIDERDNMQFFFFLLLPKEAKFISDLKSKAQLDVVAQHF